MRALLKALAISPLRGSANFNRILKSHFQMGEAIDVAYKFLKRMRTDMLAESRHYAQICHSQDAAISCYAA